MFLLLRKRDRAALECATEQLLAVRRYLPRVGREFGSRGNRVTRMSRKGREAGELPDCSRHRLQ